MPLTIESATRKDRAVRRTTMPPMQHRHYASVAAIIRELDFGAVSSADAIIMRAEIAQQFSNAMAGTNPRFDRGRFLRACEE